MVWRTIIAPQVHLHSHWLLAIGSILLFSQTGCYFAWSSPFLERLKEPDSPIPITQSQGSWIASLLNAGRVIGAVIGAVIAQTIGSRQAVCATFVPVLLGWVFILFADSVPWLYASRFTSGIATGMSYTCAPMFIGEVAVPKLRGSIVNIGFIGLTTSTVITSFLGKVLTLKEFSILYLVPCIVGLGIFLYLPDSPHYLIKREDLTSAGESFSWYRNGQSLNQEFEDIRKYIGLSGTNYSVERIIATLQTPYVRKACFIVTMLFIFEQGCGLNVLTFYTESILKDAKFVLFEPALAVVLTNFSALICGLVATTVIDRCGRRILMIVSSIGITLVMTTLGTHFLLLRLGVNPDRIQILPLSAILLFQASFSVGFMVIPSIVTSEIYPDNVKNTGACFASVVCGFFGFLMPFGYQYLTKWFGISCVYYIYGLVAFLATPFVLVFLPETKGKSLYEIQQMLLKN